MNRAQEYTLQWSGSWGIKQKKLKINNDKANDGPVKRASFSWIKHEIRPGEPNEQVNSNNAGF